MKNSNTGTRLIAFALSGVILAVFCCPATASGGPETTAVYFHSSETNINNFKSLKMAFDQYLTRHGPYAFQPVKDRTEFEKQIARSGNCLFLVSSWHYQRISRHYSSRPVLIGTRNGKTTQKRLLVARTGAPAPFSADIRVASASSMPHTRNVMRHLMQAADTIRLDDAKVLTVPKDIDALMAVSFGMSDAALITENSYDRIRRLTPVLCRNVKIVAAGPEIHLLVLAIPPGSPAKYQHLIRILKDMPNNPQGQKQMQMLGLDGFADVSREDMMRLQATTYSREAQEQK